MRTSSTDLNSKITKMQSESRCGEDGQVRPKEVLPLVSAASYSRAPKTIRDVLVDRLRPSTYSLTRPPPPLSPHSSLIEFLSLLLFLKIKPPVNAGTRTTSLWVTRELEGPIPVDSTAGFLLTDFST